MKTRFLFWTCTLIAVLGVSSCAPVASPAANRSDVPVSATVTPADSAIPVATEIIPIQAEATSRGTNLEATDPSLVNLAAGQLQLVEFFRFT